MPGSGTRPAGPGAEVAGIMDDATFGRLLGRVLEESHTTAPGALPALIGRTAAAMGLAGAAVYLADVQQGRLVALPSDAPSDDRADPAAGQAGDVLEIDGTLAGWAYRTMSERLSSGPGLTLWLPLADGIERIGVLRVAAASLDAATIDRCRTLASLTALLVESKSAFSDTVARTVRRRPMTLQAELAWAFMPPMTLGTRQVTSSAVLEPAYEIGGDAFDHSLDEGRLHLAVVDAMGHDLAAGGASAVALAGCRSVRRAGGGLAEIVAAVDGVLARWIPGRLLTAVFGEIDLAGGRLSWVNCGHPPPLLIRRQHVVPDALRRRSELPLGLGEGYPVANRTVHQTQLEPGDRVLVHTDGVTEGRGPTGEHFGEQRLLDLVVRSVAAGEPAPEALRRLVRALLDYQGAGLRDDATVLLAEWHPAP